MIDRIAPHRFSRSVAGIGQSFRYALGTLVFAAVLVALTSSPSLARYASLVMEVETGRVLHERNADTPNHPASLTKMMTLYMLFDAIKDGKANMNTRMPVSARAEGQTPTKLGLRRGETIKVEDAIKALAVRSANDVATVVAEFLGGTEIAFATMMTTRARQLGMQKTTFRNASGLHNPGQISTARDMATLGIALRRDFPQHYHYFSMQSFRWNGNTVRSHNRVVAEYAGADGLKTGYIRASGFNLATTVQRNGRTLIGIVFGGQTSGSRDRHMMALLDTAFQSMGTLASAPVPVPKPGSQLASAASDAGEFFLTEVDMPSALSGPDIGGSIDGATEAAIAPPAVSRQAWGVQVGAFSAFTTANAQAADAVRRLGVADQDVQPTVTPVTGSNGGMIYRARVIGLSDEAAARAACARLQGLDGGCVVVPPDGMDLALIR